MAGDTTRADAEPSEMLRVPLTPNRVLRGSCTLIQTNARQRRIPGGAPLQNSQVAQLCARLREDSRDFEADGRVLRLKQYVPSDLLPGHMDAILDALAANTRVEVLYIQNFEWGMLDAQLRHLGEVLANKRIWALNVGENFQITNQAWERFTLALEDTAVAYLYVSEQHLRNTDLKVRMRDAVRLHRRAGPARDPEVVDKVGNMWWNPKTSKKRRLTSTEFDRMMAAMKRRCVRHLVLQTQFDDLAKEHETALRLARDLSRECTAAQIEAAESREAEEAARERLRSYIERLQMVNVYTLTPSEK